MQAVSTPDGPAQQLPDVRVLLLPGFNTNRGHKAPVHAVQPYLEAAGAIVTPVGAYGRIGTLLDWLNVSTDSRQLALGALHWTQEESQRGVPRVAVGHSNGANIIGRAVELGAGFDLIVTINAAQPVRYRWSANVDRVVCFFSPSDRTVQIAKWSKFILGIRHLAPRRWGAAGRYGYDETINGRRVLNLDLEEWLPDSEVRHSDFSEPGNIQVFGPVLVDEIAACLPPRD